MRFTNGRKRQLGQTRPSAPGSLPVDKPIPKPIPKVLQELPKNARYDFRDFVSGSRFTNVEMLTQAAGLGDLDNDVHAIFAPEKLPNHTQTRRDALLPCLRLATRLITHKSVKPLFHTILTHGAWVDLHEKVGRVDEQKKPEAISSYSQYDSDFTRTLEKEDNDNIDAALKELAKFVDFSANEDLPVDDGDTKDIDKKPVPAGAKVLTGLTSKIKYSEAAVKKLEEADKEDVPLLLTMRFSLAITFAHEVAHAFVFTVGGRRALYNVTETFSHGEPVAEIGFSLEKALFGGTVAFLWQEPADLGDTMKDIVRHIEAGYGDGRWSFKERGRLGMNPAAHSALRGVMVMWEWPCRWIAENYQCVDAGLWMRPHVHASMRQKDVAWRVQVADVAKFFSTAFWTPSPDISMLEKKIGQGFVSFPAYPKGKVAMRVKLTAGEKKLCVPQGYRVIGKWDDIIPIPKKQ